MVLDGRTMPATIATTGSDVAVSRPRESSKHQEELVQSAFGFLQALLRAWSHLPAFQEERVPTTAFVGRPSLPLARAQATVMEMTQVNIEKSEIQFLRELPIPRFACSTDSSHSLEWDLFPYGANQATLRGSPSSRSCSLPLA